MPRLVNVSFSAPTGSAIAGGRWPGGRVGGGPTLLAVAAAGAFGNVPSTLVGNASLDDVLTGGATGSDPGDTLVAIWGQSNAITRADQSDLSIAPLSGDPELAQYMAGTKPFTRVKIWTGSTFAILTNSNSGADAGQFGNEFGMGVRWERETSSGTLYITKAAVSGAPIQTTFNPASPTTGYMYRSFRDVQLAAHAWLASHGVTVGRYNWLWVQGEANFEDTQEFYRYQLQDVLMAQRLADGLVTSNSIIVLAKMKVGSLVWSAAIDAAKEQIAATDPVHIKTVRMDYYKSAGDAHINGRGAVQLGYDTFEAMFGRPHIAT